MEKVALPSTADLMAEAHRRGVEAPALPTAGARRLLGDLDPDETHAVLHLSC